MHMCARGKREELISARLDVGKEIPKESEKIDRQEKERQSIKTDSQISKQIANTRSRVR